MVDLVVLMLLLLLLLLLRGASLVYVDAKQSGNYVVVPERTMLFACEGDQ